MQALEAAATPTTKKLRSACDSCHQTKVRCSGGQPCEKCEKIGFDCVYSVSERTGRPKDTRNKKTLERVRQSQEARRAMHNDHRNQNGRRTTPSAGCAPYSFAQAEQRNQEFPTDFVSLNPPCFNAHENSIPDGRSIVDDSSGSDHGESSYSLPSDQDLLPPRMVESLENINETDDLFSFPVILSPS